MDEPSSKPDPADARLRTRVDLMAQRVWMAEAEDTITWYYRVVTGGINGSPGRRRRAVGTPGSKVLPITGYAENAVVGNADLDAGTAILTKPSAMDDLARKIGDVVGH